jgi:hypothetical protein
MDEWVTINGLTWNAGKRLRSRGHLMPAGWAKIVRAQNTKPAVLRLTIIGIAALIVMRILLA